MAGAIGGGRVTTFMYPDITGIEYNGGFLNGVLEILTPSYQGTRNADYWRGTFASRNADANDPWVLSNTLPLNKGLYEQARPHIEGMRQLIAEAKRPVGRETTGVSEGHGSTGPNLADEIERLVELHRQGALNDDEFRQAKQALLGGTSASSRAR